jgi:hypothetical protein
MVVHQFHVFPYCVDGFTVIFYVNSVMGKVHSYSSIETGICVLFLVMVFRNIVHVSIQCLLFHSCVQLITYLSIQYKEIVFIVIGAMIMLFCLFPSQMQSLRRHSEISHVSLDAIVARVVAMRGGLFPIYLNSPAHYGAAVDSASNRN